MIAREFPEYEFTYSLTSRRSTAMCLSNMEIASWSFFETWLASFRKFVGMGFENDDRALGNATFPLLGE